MFFLLITMPLCQNGRYESQQHHHQCIHHMCDVPTGRDILVAIMWGALLSHHYLQNHSYHHHHHQAGPWKSNCNRGKLELCRYLADETWSQVTLLLIQSIKYFFQIYLSLNLAPADETWSHLVIHKYSYLCSEHILSSIFIFHCVLPLLLKHDYLYLCSEHKPLSTFP